MEGSASLMKPASFEQLSSRACVSFHQALKPGEPVRRDNVPPYCYLRRGFVSLAFRHGEAFEKDNGATSREFFSIIRRQLWRIENVPRPASCS